MLVLMIMTDLCEWYLEEKRKKLVPLLASVLCAYSRLRSPLIGSSCWSAWSPFSLKKREGFSFV
jgi:hypothetical protein